MMNYLSELFGPDIYQFVVLPLIIAIARVMDVTIGTIRVIFVARGLKKWAPVLGFFEVIIWLLAIGQIMQSLGNFMSYIGYGAGFAMGNYVGIILVERMSLGTVMIRIIPKMDTTNLINHLREANFGVTTIQAEGKSGPVQIVNSIIKKKDLKDALKIINTHNPNAFYTVEEVEKVNEGYFKHKNARQGFFNSLLSGIQNRK